MNWDQIEGQWQNLKGTIRQKWAKLTDDDFESIAGKKDRLLGKIRERYGYEKEGAENELNTFLDGLNSKPLPH